MTDHVRKQIRAAAATALTGLATTSTRVYDSRVYPMQDENLPGLRVFTPSESSQPLEMGRTRARARNLILVVEACVKANTSYADTADLITKEVETALDADNTLGGLCKMIEPVGYEEILSGEGEHPIVVGRMRFEVTYHMRMGSPDVAA